MGTEIVPTSEILDEIKHVEAKIKEVKDEISFAEKIEALHDNEVFQDVIIEGYFEKEAQRVFGLLVTPTTLKRDAIENTMDKLSSIRNLKSFFAMHLRNLQSNQEVLDDLETYLANLRNSNGGSDE